MTKPELYQNMTERIQNLVFPPGSCGWYIIFVTWLVTMLTICMMLPAVFDPLMSVAAGGAPLAVLLFRIMGDFLTIFTGFLVVSAAFDALAIGRPRQRDEKIP